MPFSNTIRHKMMTKEHGKRFVIEPLMPGLMVRDMTAPLDKLDIIGLTGLRMAWAK